MKVRPAKARSGIAIKNAFRFAAKEILGEKRYVASLEQRRGEMLFDFSGNAESPTLSYATGDSVRISNSAGKTVRLSLVPMRDEDVYEQFEILAVDLGREFEFDRLAQFEDELVELLSLINRRLEMWGIGDTDIAVA